MTLIDSIDNLHKRIIASRLGLLPKIMLVEFLIQQLNQTNARLHEQVARLIEGCNGAFCLLCDDASVIGRIRQLHGDRLVKLTRRERRRVQKDVNRPHQVTLLPKLFGCPRSIETDRIQDGL